MVESLGSVLCFIGYNTTPPLMNCVASVGLCTKDVPQIFHLETGSDTYKELGTK